MPLSADMQDTGQKKTLNVFQGAKIKLTTWAWCSYSLLWVYDTDSRGHKNTMIFWLKVDCLTFTLTTSSLWKWNIPKHLHWHKLMIKSIQENAADSRVWSTVFYRTTAAKSISFNWLDLQSKCTPDKTEKESIKCWLYPSSFVNWLTVPPHPPTPNVLKNCNKTSIALSNCFSRTW